MAETTFFPAAGANSPVAGYITNALGDVSWASNHDATDGTAINVTGAGSGFLIESGSGATAWQTINRAVALFDTSSLDDADIVSGGTISIYADTRAETFTSATGQINVYAATPASNDNLVTEDFDQFGTTAYATAIATAGSTGAYVDWTLNATGFGAITLTGITKMGFRTTWDAADSPPSHEANKNNLFWATGSDYAGTTRDPKLVVSHAAATGHINLLLLGVG